MHLPCRVLVCGWLLGGLPVADAHAATALPVGTPVPVGKASGASGTRFVGNSPGLLAGSHEFIQVHRLHVQPTSREVQLLPVAWEAEPEGTYGPWRVAETVVDLGFRPEASAGLEVIPVAFLTGSSGTPAGMPDRYAVPADRTLTLAAPGFLANDIDPTGEALSAVSIQDNVDHGILAAFTDGSFTYTPDPGFTGTDSFAYRMRDASNNFSDPIPVTLQVLAPANRTPLGTPDTYSLLAPATLSIAAPGFLANDLDLDGEVLSAVSIQDNVDHGVLAAFTDGSFTYTPDPGFSGTDSFAYRMRDASGNFSDPVTVTLVVAAGNRGPIGLADAFATAINTPLSIPAPGFLANDRDLDGEALSAVSIQDNVDHGVLAAFADGSFSYTPDPGFTGTDAFAYRMRDASNHFSDPIAVAIEVLPAGLTPFGSPDRYTVSNDQTLSLAAPGFLANDVDLNGEAITAVSIADNVDHGVLAAFADGSFTYTPDPGFTGTDSFAYRMRDASNNFSEPVAVTIDVLPAANRAPLGHPDTYTLLADTTLSVAASGFLLNDIDLDGEVLSAVSIQDNVDHGTLAAFADGSFTYTPDPGFTGTDFFAYRLRDASNHFSDPVTVTLVVSAGNRRPVGLGDTFATWTGIPRSIAAPGFLANDLDLDGEAISAVSIADNVDHGILAAFADGSFNYTPDPGFSGTDSFYYRLRDASGNVSDPVRVVIAVIDPNRVCVNDLATRAKTGRVQLTWTHTGADHYNVYRGTVRGGPYARLAATSPGLATYLDTTVTNGTTYYYVIREANLADEEECQSNEASARPVGR